MAMQYYKWTATADGHLVMGAVRSEGEIFTSEEFTNSQIRHLAGLSFAETCDAPAQATTDPLAEKIARLETLYAENTWRAIAALGENYGIEKPDGGWDDAIPLIAQAELDSEAE